jgi:hypothetical protein
LLLLNLRFGVVTTRFFLRTNRRMILETLSFFLVNTHPDDCILVPKNVGVLHLTWIIFYDLFYCLSISELVSVWNMECQLMHGISNVKYIFTLQIFSIRRAANVRRHILHLSTIRFYLFLFIHILWQWMKIKLTIGRFLVL